MAQVFASLGSNQERERNIRSAVIELGKIYGELQCSPVYRNKAVGFAGDDFLNMVVAFETQRSPEQIQQDFHVIEAAHGRCRGDDKFIPRNLDIDLILYGSQVSERPRLPREDILRYAFVLKPLADLAPDLQHPVLRESYAELWNKFTGERALTPVAGVLAE